MPSNYKSPFASSFNSACNRGTSFNVAVNNIAKRNKKTPEFVWESLFKAGLCFRQKFNGQWIYFPCNVKKCNVATNKATQHQMWQWFCEWCLTNGCCTPEQMKNNCGNQKSFMTWCKKFWGKQYTWTNTTTTTGTKTKRTGTTKSYSFSGSKTRKGSWKKAA